MPHRQHGDDGWEKKQVVAPADKYLVMTRDKREWGRFTKLIMAYDCADHVLAKGFDAVGIKNLKTEEWIVISYVEKKGKLDDSKR